MAGVTRGRGEGPVTRNVSDQRGHSLATRIVVISGAALAFLLVGAAIGLLITVPTNSRTEPRPGKIEIGFAQDMSVHHRQTVTMATLARQQGHSPAVRQLAFDIETSQRDQVGRMRGWLGLWHEPTQPTDGHGEWMRVRDGHEHAATAPGGRNHMPGMANRQELAQLRGLRGPEFDIYFLQLMLRHHKGTLPMAEQASMHAALPPVSALAQSMITAQSSESDLITGMLAQRRADPLPPS